MNLSQFRALIIDDVDIPRAILKKMLLKFGILEKNIFELSTAINAMQFIVEKKIDLVISDWAMPDVEGIDLLKQVREDYRTANIPFVITTSYSDKQKVEEALDSRVTDFLLKPFSYETFNDKLLKLLNN